MFAAKDTLLTRPSGAYRISRSVRLRASASAYLNRTLTTPTNNKIWTWSGWVKRGILGTATNRTLFRAGVSSPSNGIRFEATTDVLRLFFNDASSGDLITTQVFRDPAAWYHIIVAVDTTQATAANRAKIYINGTQVTAFSTASYPAQNYDPQINSAILHTIGAFNASGTPSEFFDGYLTEVNFIDGQALTPSSFGETNAVTGVWQPKAYTGTYGTNGFELNFSDNSAATAAAIGKDYSGNGNNWTPNNISVTAGVTYDSMLDVPTLYADGGNGRGNYAVLNPLSLGSTVTLSNGNLTMTEVGTYATTVSSIGVTSGKWYAEMTVGSNTFAGTCGVARLGYSPTSRLGFQANTWSYNNDGGLYYNSLTLASVSSYTTGDVIGIALDVDNLTIALYKNNTLQGTQYTAANSGLTAGEFYFATGHINSTSNWNFGQRPFSYTPPSGFVALNTQNLPTPTISNGATVMAATTYTGTGATQSISNAVNGISFQPDFVWFKSRATTFAHALFDSVRGVTKGLASNDTATEFTSTAGNDLAAFTSTGFTVGAPQNWNSPNNATSNPVAWQWNAGGSTVTNTSGTISAQVRANTTAGFSVVTYTGTGANATVGHGLGVTPSMVIVKARSTTGNWCVTMPTLGSNNVVFLDLTNAVANFPTVFNGLPTSTIFNIGTAGSTNTSAATFVAYCFAAVAGYSAFGSYTGNASTDGPFVYLGFRPRWVMFKRTDSADDWIVFDTSRNTYDVMNSTLFPNGSYSETTDSNRMIDSLSNGFKVRSSPVYINASGGTYIYAAFAENPFKLSLAR